MPKLPIFRKLEKDRPSFKVFPLGRKRWIPSAMANATMADGQVRLPLRKTNR